MFGPAYGGPGFDPNNPADLYQMARGGRRPMMQRFDEYYRCYPMVMAPGAERPTLNYGSKIFLPPSALDKVSKMHVQWPIMLELINGDKGRHTHGGVLEFVAEEGRAYIPQWMMQTLQLDVGDMIQIKTTSLELAKLVKLQPQSVNFLDISDPRAVLEKAFRNFAALTKGDTFNFEYNDEVYDVAVLDVKPETAKMGVSMIETDVSVEFAPPVGYVEPAAATSSAAASGRGSGTSTPRSTRGPALPAGGLLHSQGTMAQAINYDAIAAAATNTNFRGEGQRLTSKKPPPPPPTTTTGSSSNKPATPPVAAAVAGAPAAPMPLRLPPGKLFLGYEVKPVKTAADKEAEVEAARRPHFAGQGQTLRGAVKRKGDAGSGEAGGKKKAADEGKGRRLDGRKV
ncbi:ubiquitin fusion degradation protein UFD1-domain-containing protein [Phialemonium atrogriseum]|uniref:Ubiquitin fusion degradation protein UFD1-domain-containing protein n=1 Tax=Phialemonium atrogriseum TaxID=1093897 RepID=A0AAJ0CBM8_9PEZI|nr:ubiquitin fusion degradation protein UFD1-domain-containing protein [Phialemonium atrogriseum]KAK1772518.1 ubiquitin fusion degradation protein UFD1-domain-containing protein [Phialemonium atrogriseum]